MRCSSCFYLELSCITASTFISPYPRYAYDVLLFVILFAIIDDDNDLRLKVDENMKRAQRRDAARAEKFYFRKDVFPAGVPSPLSTPLSSPHSSGASSPIEPNGTNGIHIHKSRKLQNCFGEVPRPEKNDVFGKIEDEYDEFTLNEIFNGKGDQFPGLLSLVRSYLETLEVEASELLRIREYLDLIEQRSNGKLFIAVVIPRNSQLIFV